MLFHVLFYNQAWEMRINVSVKSIKKFQDMGGQETFPENGHKAVEIIIIRMINNTGNILETFSTWLICIINLYLCHSNVA